MKQFWPKQSIKDIEVTNTLETNQWVLRLNCSTYNLALVDEFITKVHRLTFSILFKLPNNANDFLDKSTLSHAIFNSHKFKFLDKICKMHSLTLRYAKYRVQTALGTSLSQYNNSSTLPIHNTREDSGSFGSHWVYITVQWLTP